MAIVADRLASGVAFTPVDRYFIEGLEPYEARVVLSARVGLASTLHDVENIEVRFMNPLP